MLKLFVVDHNLFIYQARVQPGPSRVSDSPVSAENVIHDAFVVMGELHCIHEGKEKQRQDHSSSSQASLHITFPPGKQWSEASPNFPHQNKGFINYVFCRNWAVRNPAATRLDSSLVNKQVGYIYTKGQQDSGTKAQYICCSVSSVQCIVYSVWCYIVIVCSVQCIVYSLYYSVQQIVYIVQCIIYSVYCIVYSVQFKA